MTLGADEMQSDFRATTRDSDWRLFAPLLLVALIASLAVVPYLLEIMAASGSVVTWWTLAPSVMAERLVLSAIAIWIGLKLGPGLGLGAPVVSNWVAGQAQLRRHRRLLLPSLICGVCVAVAIGIGSPWLEKSLMPAWPESARQAEDAAAQMAAWKTILASLSAGVVEELLFRFGVMTLFVWIIAKLSGRRPPSAIVFWTGNFLAALLFGLIHLTNVAELGIAITSSTVLYVTLANGIGGITFGSVVAEFGAGAPANQNRALCLSQQNGTEVAPVPQMPK
jgi:hypothetical protein